MADLIISPTMDAFLEETGSLPPARIGADTIDSMTEIASSIKEGSGSKLMTTRTGVYRTIPVPAGAMLARTTNGAEAATHSGTNVEMDCFLFDSITEEGVTFGLPMPAEWDNGTIKVEVFWTPDTGASASDGVTWGVAAQALSNDDSIDTAYGTSTDTDDTTIAVGDMHTIVSSSITVAGSPANSDWLAFEITRVVGDANDNQTEDAKLLGVRIQYLESSTEPSAL